jgi:hypothetical protein
MPTIIRPNQKRHTRKSLRTGSSHRKKVACLCLRKNYESSTVSARYEFEARFFCVLDRVPCMGNQFISNSLYHKTKNAPKKQPAYGVEVACQIGLRSEAFVIREMFSGMSRENH